MGGEKKYARGREYGEDKGAATKGVRKKRR